MERKYPIGIQTFSEVIRNGYVYVDKTDLVWRLKDYAKYVFMSRPRRFGKSLLTSTLESYFSGKKELFQGLKIMDLEQDWKQYPVIHLDLSGAKHMPAQGVRDELTRIVSEYVSMLNVYVRTQVKCAGGRVDMVVWMPDVIYVFELKVTGTAQEALAQIDDKSYAIPFSSESRKVVKVGVKFNKDNRSPEDWIWS